MGVTSALMLGSAAVSMAGSIAQGIGENQQAQRNASIYEQQAGIYDIQAQNIATQKQILAGQYGTKRNVLEGEAVTTAARGGLKISGSVANSISNSITQLQMEESYQQYNLDLKRQEALNARQMAYDEADLQRTKGRQAMMNGFLKAGSTALSAGSSYYNKYWGGALNMPKNAANQISGGFGTDFNIG